jgi:hypothetical protein
MWDRIGGSFRYPSSFEGKGPADEILKKEAEEAKMQTGDHVANGKFE